MVRHSQAKQLHQCAAEQKTTQVDWEIKRRCQNALCLVVFENFFEQGLPIPVIEKEISIKACILFRCAFLFFQAKVS